MHAQYISTIILGRLLIFANILVNILTNILADISARAVTYHTIIMGHNYNGTKL
jgi:hypothetical protein